MIHDVTNRYPMVYDRMFRTAIYQKAPSQIATVLWKWVPVLGSQTSQRVRPSVSTGTCPYDCDSDMTNMVRIYKLSESEAGTSKCVDVIIDEGEFGFKIIIREV